ncbi:HTH-type transcriptional regulator PuuR [wastewater metagenome]|uniref:HTH-type transcriptional regulator PuuR n=2 Tax=unclassified sequences TaxID=12908 RepID=A0A5B8R9T0_9ZZZZ|nr:MULTISPECIES: cupin domain-containing protein [Arhodomonas]MCS4504926.1 cupin domain-containing protein [Arhodomonas aquaeolei]QEA04122.1 HTH-type transcriptional regulator PuuR [uncultured organism]
MNTSTGQSQERSPEEADPVFDLGERLRQVRLDRGLSQRELARRAGVTNGTISLIEQNKNSPSVASLKKVLDGVPMSLAEFFAVGAQAADRVFFRRDELSLITSGPLEFRQVGNVQGKSLQVLREYYPPGGDTGRAMLRHDSEEAGIVISGRVELTVGSRRRVLGPGDAYHFDSRIPHRFRNLDDEDCELISACTPPYL